MKTSTGKPTKAEQRRFRALMEIGCIACQMELKAYDVPEIHHLLSGGRRRGHLFTIPLCPWHHRGYFTTTLHFVETIFGPSLARNPKGFRAHFGTDDELLAKVNEMLI